MLLNFFILPWQAAPHSKGTDIARPKLLRGSGL